VIAGHATLDVPQGTGAQTLPWAVRHDVKPGSTLLGMSPVSRGRKSKKQRKAQKSRQRTAKATAQRSTGSLVALRDQLWGPPQRPAWFDPSIARMLREGEAVLTATGPRQLEQAAAELTGAEVYRAVREAGEGLWFGWWFQELARAAAERVEAEASREGDAWRAPWRLLHGLAAIGSPTLRSAALLTARNAVGVLASSQVSAEPAWLSLCPDGAVTGQVWRMRDDYRARFAVLAECGYPGGGADPRGADPHVFLLDIDTCGFVTPAGAAVFDSLEQAAAAWRRDKGDAAESAHPELVTEYAQLDCLVHCEVSPDGMFRGGEPRAFTDNLFRASRRIHDIAEAMGGKGQQWPEHRNLHVDRDTEIEAAAKAFGTWYARRHGSEPHQEATQWLAGDWLQGTLPGCGNAVSPHRVKHLMACMDDDWLPGEAATKAAYELLPEWVRWNGEQAGVPGHLIERSAAIAEGQPWNADECPAFAF
jgi:hypothetical protein